MSMRSVSERDRSWLMPRTRAPTSTGDRLEGLLAGKSEQAADQFGAAAGGGEGRLEVIPRSPGGRAACPQRVQVAGDDGEQVVEVVGEAAGELADGFHLLGLDQGGLAGFLLGDVDGQHEKALHAAGFGGFWHHHAACVHLAFAGGIGAAVFVADPLAGGGLVEVGPDLGVGVDAEDFGRCCVPTMVFLSRPNQSA
jgi:hypothetical protein